MNKALDIKIEELETEVNTIIDEPIHPNLIIEK